MTQPANEPQRFRIQIEKDGVYRIGYDQLEAAGLNRPIASDWLAISNLGRPVAMRVEDHGDAQFGPGDSLTFVGRQLRGENSHDHEFSPFNVYVLDIGAHSEPVRMINAAVAPTDLANRAPARLRRRTHIEQDLLRLPVFGPSGSYGEETLWYWKQLNHLASEPTRIPIDLSSLDRDAEASFDLKLQFRGWSDSASTAFLPIPDHVVEVALNGSPLGTAQWRGRETQLLDLSRIPLELARDGENVIEIRVPLRRHGSNADPVIDVVYLDWLEAEFPRGSGLDEGQELIHVSAVGHAQRLRLKPARRPTGDDPVRIELFDDDGSSVVASVRSDGTDAGAVFEAWIPDQMRRIWVVPNDRFLRPQSISLDRPSQLAESTEQRDYFIITHPSLTEATQPLVRFHERNGTRTELVDVQDIYDEFNFGIKHPRAIRDFLAHARIYREAPAPGHVLLVGDASWYAREPADESAENARYNERDLIPTWQLRSRDGPAASDNPFVTLVGDDVFPDMAIGRFPATSPAEVRAMVDKTVAYMEKPAPGAWRSRILLASEPTGNLSARNEQLGRLAREAGLNPDELLADPAADGEQHQKRIRTALNEGMLVLHFFGHGGRFMWQMAPSSGNVGNLFDMADLDMLAPSARHPIVLSMSCATGPFDHPAADSLAEKFLRIRGRGAVAVLAASARNSPSLGFTNSLLEGILSTGTLGEAVQAAKSARMHPDSALFYNLLGDPALVPARPERGLTSGHEISN
ncbi:MAG: C25 family cysteine peptidase [Xanthomonadaceae bacterium]|nr:C25 family cysteine peptidase [Xanthomonadaceae bacterium]